MTRTKTAIPNRTTSASRPSSENPTKAIDGKREPADQQGDPIIGEVSGSGSACSCRSTKTIG